MSAPLPACSRTMPMMAKHMSTCTTVSAMTILIPSRGGAPRRFPDNGYEAGAGEAAPADQRPVDFVLGQQLVGVVGLDAAAIQNADCLRGFLGGDLGQQPAQVAVDLRGLGRRRIHAGADRP